MGKHFTLPYDGGLIEKNLQGPVVLLAMGIQVGETQVVGAYPHRYLLPAGAQKGRRRKAQE